MTAKKTPSTSDDKGACFICGETVSNRMAKRHAVKCRAEHPLPTSKQKAEIFTILVTTPYTSEYRLIIEIAGSKKLETLDDFLRKIWLECCGHLSVFRINGARYESFTDFESIFADEKEPQGMDVKICDVLALGMSFKHDYDFGSTTSLELSVIGIREAMEAAPRAPRLIFRNHPPEMKCAICKKPATRVNSGYNGAYPESVFCDDCKPEDPEYDYGWLPIVNSPRCGVCAYGAD